MKEYLYLNIEEKMKIKIQAIVSCLMPHYYKNEIDDTIYYIDKIIAHYEVRANNYKIRITKHEHFLEQLKVIKEFGDITYKCVWHWLENADSEEYYKFMQLSNSVRCKRAIAKGKDFYKSKEWLELRQRILKRDGFKCKECGIKENLHIHHIKYKHGSNLKKDLITLCVDCHKTKHPINSKFIN